jgi:hypothetical protein
MSEDQDPRQGYFWYVVKFGDLQNTLGTLVTNVKRYEVYAVDSHGRPLNDQPLFNLTRNSRLTQSPQSNGGHTFGSNCCDPDAYQFIIRAEEVLADIVLGIQPVSNDGHRLPFVGFTSPLVDKMDGTAYTYTGQLELRMPSQVAANIEYTKDAAYDYFASAIAAAVTPPVDVSQVVVSEIKITNSNGIARVLVKRRLQAVPAGYDTKVEVKYEVLSNVQLGELSVDQGTFLNTLAIGAAQSGTTVNMLQVISAPSPAEYRIFATTTTTAREESAVDGDSEPLETGYIILIIICSLLVVAVILAGCFLYARKKRSGAPQVVEPDTSEAVQTPAPTSPTAQEEVNVVVESLEQEEVSI